MTTALNFVEPVSQPAYLKTWPRSRSRIATFAHEAIENGEEQGGFELRASIDRRVERNRMNRQVEESIERIDV